MASDVRAMMQRILQESNWKNSVKAETILECMFKDGTYIEDVWV